MVDRNLYRDRDAMDQQPMSTNLFSALGAQDSTQYTRKKAETVTASLEAYLNVPSGLRKSKLYKAGPHNLCSSSNIFSFIQSSGLRWARHVACREIKKCIKILVGKPEEKILLENSKSIRENNSKLIKNMYYTAV
jgi:hypothetical protein